MSNLLQTRLLAAFPDGFIASHTKNDWSSITFTGERHQVCLRFEDEFRAAQCAVAVNSEKVDVNLDDAGQLFAGAFLVETDDHDGCFYITMEIVTLND